MRKAWRRGLGLGVLALGLLWAGRLADSAAAEGVTPLILGKWPGHPRTPSSDIVLDGKRAFLIFTNGGFGILNISDPGNPLPVGGFTFRGRTTHIAAAGNHVFMGGESAATEGYRGLNILDVSDPANVRLIARYPTSISLSGLALMEKVVLLSNRHGLEVVDIADPRAARRISLIRDLPAASDIAVKGEFALLAAGAAGLIIVDMTQRAQPRVVGSLQTGGPYNQVEVSGSLAFLSHPTNGLSIVDISIPATPTLLGQYAANGAGRLAVDGSLAYLMRASISPFVQSIRVLDISVPSNVREVGTVTGAALGIAAERGHAYVASYTQGFRIFDMSRPAEPTLLATYEASGEAKDVAIGGNIAFLADGYAGVQILDLTDLGLPRRVARYDTPGEALHVALSGTYAFVADNTEGVRILDVSEPAAPTLAGWSRTTAPALSVTLAGRRAYVAGSYRGLFILDVSVPLLVREIASRYAPHSRSVALFGDYAAVAQSTNGLHIYSVAGDALQPVSSIAVPGSAWSVAPWGSHAVVAALDGGLHVINLSDPRAPRLVGSYTPEAQVQDVAITGNLAIATGSTLGLRFLDLSDPARPVLKHSMPLNASSVTVASGKIYATGADGLTIIGLQPALSISERGGEVTLSLHTLSPLPVALESSTDLIVWTPFITAHSWPEQPFRIQIPASGLRRFFRARQ